MSQRCNKAERKKDSFDRLSEAKARQSYPGLNEPGTTLLSFAFAVVEVNPDGWRSQPTCATLGKVAACSWTEPHEPDTEVLNVAPEG